MEAEQRLKQQQEKYNQDWLEVQRMIDRLGAKEKDKILNLRDAIELKEKENEVASLNKF